MLRIGRECPSISLWDFTNTQPNYGDLIIVSIPLMMGSLEGMPSEPKALWQTGFGAIRGNNLLSIRTSLLGGVLIANTPQALLPYM